MGTGSGKWVIEVAEQYPSARVLGMDLSPAQPKQIPLNADFIVGDLTHNLEFDSGSTDLVNSRS